VLGQSGLYLTGFDSVSTNLDLLVDPAEVLDIAVGGLPPQIP